jgi:hypothetical protein
MAEEGCNSSRLIKRRTKENPATPTVETITQPFHTRKKGMIMSSFYNSAFTNLNGCVSFGGGANGGRSDSKKDKSSKETEQRNREAEFARQNSAARNRNGSYEGIKRSDITNLATAGGGLAGSFARNAATRFGGFATAVVSERQR